MSISDTKAAQKYASIAEVAAAQAKEVLTEALLAPEYAGQAAASAAEAASSAQQAQDAAGNAASNATEYINDQLVEQKTEFDADQTERKQEYANTLANLIPLSRQYMTLPAAQADIANIPVGSVTYVRSSDGSTLADEYENIAGTLTATGRSMPSQQEVSFLNDSVSDEINLRQSLITGGPGPSRAPGYIVIFADENGREVFGYRSSDGAPSDHSMKKIIMRIGESNPLPVKGSVPGYELAYTMPDSEGNLRLTQLCLMQDSGKFADWVLKEWAVRMAPTLSDLISIESERPTFAGTWKHPSGKYLPYRGDRRTIVNLGSSSAERSATWYTQMASDLGCSVVNMGWGGANSIQNAMFMGVITPLMTSVTGSIPASGSVEMTSSGFDASLFTKQTPGELLGIKGVMNYVYGSGSPTCTFTRTTPGASVALPANTPFIVDNVKYRSNFLLLETGKNDLNQGRTAEAINATILSIVEWMAPFYPEIVVVGQFANNWAIGSTQRNRMNQSIADNKIRYGANFIDQQEWLTSSQLWIDLANEGVQPTAQDLADQAAGNVPQTLMIPARDHLTPDGYHYREKYLIRKKLIELGFNEVNK